MSSRHDADGGRRSIRRTGCSGGRTSGGWRPRRSATRCWPSAARSTGRWAARCCTSRTATTSSTTRRRTRPTYDSRRRSLYLPVVRNNLYDVFQLFDFPDAGRRQRRPRDDDRRPAGAVHDEQRPGRSRPRDGLADRAARGRRRSTTPAGSRRLYATGLRPPADRGRSRARPRRSSADSTRRSRPTEPTRPATRLGLGRRSARSSLAANEFIYVR